MERNWDWKRLGVALAAARASMGMTQVELAGRIDAGLSTVSNIEGGQPYKSVTRTIREYARTVGWQHGSVEHVLDGGDPLLTERSAPPAQEASARPDAAAQTGVISPRSGLPLVIREIMENGEIWDTSITHVTEGGADMRVISITVIPPNEAPEVKQANREAWDSIQPRLRAIVDTNSKQSSKDDQ